MFDWLLSHFVSWFWSLFGALRWFGDLAIASVLGAVATYIPSTASAISGISTTLAHVNYFVPLSESVVLGGVYMLLWGVVVAYKLVKSWIPTVATS